MKNIIVIPARMGSSRFPGKPLINIKKIPMVVHVWIRCKMLNLVDEVYVATCDNIIKEVCEKYGAKVIMTSKKHKMCMERVAEAVKKIQCKNIITVQGDEPLIQKNDIEIVRKKIEKLKKHESVSLVQKIKITKEINNKNRVKVIMNKRKKILYISRETIPSKNFFKNYKSYYKLGNIYGISKNFLKKYPKLKASKLEKLESVDMNRIIDYDYNLYGVESKSNLVSVDVPNDLKIVNKLIVKDTFFKKYKNYYAKS